MKDPHRDEEEIGEYRSKDLEFGQAEQYEPEYPLTRGEERLLQLNKTDATSFPAEQWLKDKLKPVVRQELERTDKEQ